MFTSENECEVRVSFFRDGWFDDQKRWTLHQSKVTQMARYAGFNDFIERFFDTARYPNPQRHKFETYGWCPVWFNEGHNSAGKWGRWRAGAHSHHTVSCFYADLDNNHLFEPLVSMDKVERVLADLGLKYFLYTSFSHTAAKHKVRIMIPISRPMTYPETFKVFQYFNWKFSSQLDHTIYDDGDFLYGPTYDGEFILNDGLAIHVDNLLQELEDGLVPLAALRGPGTRQTPLCDRPKSPSEKSY